ncbi:class I SAM-dependent methyltransferase [Corynebacterium sp. TAE3-ERU12]|uniref:class I SAM-dependent methyltransferase n=1 Tax=Corynebacterium sp. TAE3-ERU12 TaxID=2849491 RepID=UPI001C45873E|nr:class I SAM-dependent methyltransferase [Corynebacterium sp. TAE3-ERU12]MBV7294482.1 class I SAM-dependent methyltransferase [Corynebacterium sp. TAE3-ERU12]
MPTTRREFAPDYFGDPDLAPDNTIAEDYWDGRAAGFAVSQDCDDGVLTDSVLTRLSRHIDVAGKTVLDVGAGTGRYGLRMAATAREITCTDISTKMLAEAAERAARRAVNLRTVHADWLGVDLDAQGWANAFDLVFASMVPVLRQPAAVDKLTAASRGLVAINHLALDQDDIADFVRLQLGIQDQTDAHNDASFISDVVRYLSGKGVPCVVEEPEVITEKPMNFDNLIARYSGRFAEAARQYGTTLADVLEPLHQRHGDAIPVRRHVRAGIIIWGAGDA